MPSKKTVVMLDKQHDTAKQVIEINQYKIGLYLKKCPTNNGSNEDSLFIYSDEKVICFGVSDGAGGHPRGADASSLAVHSMINFLEKNEEIHPNFIQAINRANESVMEMKAGARCTLCFGYISDNQFSCHNVGDSEIVYWNSKGNEIYSNVPHSNVGYLIEGGALEQSESLDAPERHIVSSLIGDPTLRVESSTQMETKKGQTIIVGSDGVFDNISHEELCQIVTKGAFENSFEELCRICEEQDPEKWKKPDDISFILIRKSNAD